MKLKVLGFVLSLLLFSFCTRKNNSDSVEIKFQRFDKEIVQFSSDSADYYINFFNSKYGRFFEIYNQSILNVGSSNSKAYSDYLLRKINDYYSHLLFNEMDKKFQDLGDIESDLSKAFSKWHLLFPDKIVPEFITFMGGLNQSIVVTDSVIAVGLDKYLGSDFEIYTSSGFYNYQVANMRAEKIASDCVKAWLITEWELDDESDLMAQMLHQGKILYLVKYFLPEITDEVLMGFSKDQMQWVKNNEGQVWNFLIEEKLLFTTDYKTIKKLTSEGPFTSLFTQESPARTVNWLGYQIITKFAERNKEVAIVELMGNSDSQDILKRSKYKPKQ